MLPDESGQWELLLPKNWFFTFRDSESLSCLILSALVSREANVVPVDHSFYIWLLISAQLLRGLDYRAACSSK